MMKDFLMEVRKCLQSSNFNNKGTENVEDDVILDWRAYWDCDGEYYYWEPGVIGEKVAEKGQ